MARFDAAYKLIVDLEGGFKLIDDPADRGGQTWTGISRRYHPDWPGWKIIDNPPKDQLADLSDLLRLTESFYLNEYWDRLCLSEVLSQNAADTIMSCGVLGGKRVASRLAQLACGAPVDGRIGPVTLKKLNEVDEELWELRFAVARIARYLKIVKRDRTQRKYICGWITRALGDID